MVIDTVESTILSKPRRQTDTWLLKKNLTEWTHITLRQRTVQKFVRWKLNKQQGHQNHPWKSYATLTDGNILIIVDDEEKL